MSGSRFSIFRSKRKPPPPTRHKVIVGGSQFSSGMIQLMRLNRERIKQNKPNTINFLFSDFALSARCPRRSMLDYFTDEAVAFVFIFEKPREYFNPPLLPNRESDMDYMVNKKKNNVILILFDFQDEEKVGERDPVYENWINKIRNEHRVAIFDVSTERKEKMEEAYEWLNEQVSLDIAPQEAEIEEKKIKDKASGYRWLAKLSKVLTFGAYAS